MQRGVPVSLVPLMMLSGRILELAAEFALALGIVPRVPAIFVSHSFWRVAGKAAFQGQVINFLRTSPLGVVVSCLSLCRKGNHLYGHGGRSSAGAIGGSHQTRTQLRLEVAKL